MKCKLLLYFALISNVCFANMASPLRQGTIIANALVSNDVSILQEQLAIKVLKGFKTAEFSITYQIKTTIEGGQIPLLFLAKEYKDHFKVWVDDQLITIKEIPNNIINTENTAFANFNNSFAFRESGNQHVNINWGNNEEHVYKLNDLKYFEAILKKGEHTIKVSYTANVWVYNAEWIKEYSFRYSLAPAAYWKSFGGLAVNIIDESGVTMVSTNLGNPIERSFGSNSNWKFNKLPVDILEINYRPVIGTLASMLIAINPFIVMIICGTLLFLFHLKVCIMYRKRDVTKRFSWVVVLGSFFFPFLILSTYIASYVVIERLLGAHCSTRVGYYFLILGFYPFLVPIYLIGMWLIDWVVKKRLLKQNL